MVAVICVVPAATPVASPPDAVMVAVAVVPEAHVTVDVISAVELSLYVPVAVNCCVAPTFKFAGVAGVTAIELRVFVVGCGEPLHPAMRPTNNSGATTAKRRPRDFIFPPRKAHPKFFGGTPTFGRRSVQRAAFRGLVRIPKLSALDATRSEEHTSELQSPCNLVCRLLLEK